MGRLDDLKKLKAAAASKLTDDNGRPTLGKAAGDVVVGAAGFVDGVDSVAARSGLTNKNGDISALKVARAAFRPTNSAKTVLSATADEIQSRRESGERGSAD